MHKNAALCLLGVDVGEQTANTVTQVTSRSHVLLVCFPFNRQVPVYFYTEGPSLIDRTSAFLSVETFHLFSRYGVI